MIWRQILLQGEQAHSDLRSTWSFDFSLTAEYFAYLYKKHNLEGGHVIKLGSGNDDAALEALCAWPGPAFSPAFWACVMMAQTHYRLGEGYTTRMPITGLKLELVRYSCFVILQRCRSKSVGHRNVLSLSEWPFLFGQFKNYMLSGWKGKTRRWYQVWDTTRRYHIHRSDLVYSCRRRENKWLVAMNKWQQITNMEVCKGDFSVTLLWYISIDWNHLLESLDLLSQYCRLELLYFMRQDAWRLLSEFLIHAADVEGLCQGIDEDLVRSMCKFFESKISALSKA